MSQQILNIFHFNDIYSLEPRDKQPKGGAAYFCSLLERERSKCPHTLTLFSGDVFSPALLSTQFKGQNMILPLNRLGIDMACCGNHDFDFQLQHVVKLLRSTNFPWMLSNVYDRRTKRRMAQVQQYRIVTVNGLKVGVFSLAQAEWIDTLYPFYKQICVYIDFIEVAVQMVNKLKECKCDLIIALTHMMKYNDIKLANEVDGIDLILGGHDHLVVAEQIRNSFLVKSGSDFKTFTIVHITQSTQPHTKYHFTTTLKHVHHLNQQIVPDPQLHSYITGIYEKFKLIQEQVACFTEKELDLRFCTIRTNPSSFLQFLVSIYRHQTNADCAIMNSGNFRMDCMIKSGPIKFGTITNVILDTIVVKRISGNVLIQALENCVSMYPNFAGRYSAMSGIEFTWDCSAPVNHRILIPTIKVKGENIVIDKIYTVAMHSFMASGGDGFDCLKQCETVDRGNNAKNNMQLIQSLLKLNPYLLDHYKIKYPNHYTEILFQGKKYLSLTLPDPKNVKMIGNHQ